MSDPNRIRPTDNEIKTIYEWFKKQTSFPNEINENLLNKFICISDFDIEETKKLLNLFYTLRSKCPELFANRDPHNSDIQNAYTMGSVCPLTELTPDRYKVIMYKLRDPDPNVCQFNPLMKYILMVDDIRLITETEPSIGDIIIIDMVGFSLWHIPTLVYSTLKKLIFYAQEAHPLLLKQIHVINTASYVNKIYNIIKPLLNSDVVSMIHFHTPDSETLYEYVPKNILPKDYGGNDDKMEDLRIYWVEKVIAHRDYFLSESFWNNDESKKCHENGIGIINYLSFE